jgi:hypothetical protein
MHLLVNTDNFGSDYPNESFLKKDGYLTPGELFWTKEENEAARYADKSAADNVAGQINKKWGGEMSPRYVKVVQVGYKLQPGFEP